MSPFQHAYLKYVTRSDSAQGFTLIELLVTVLIIGILSAIALPSMLNQANRAREAEAQNYVGAVTRAQQVYRLQYPTFANSMAQLEISVPTQSNAYTYAFATASATLGEYQASPSQAGLRAFTGCTRATNSTSVTTTDTEILETAAAGTTPVTPPTCP